VSEHRTGGEQRADREKKEVNLLKKRLKRGEIVKERGEKKKVPGNGQGEKKERERKGPRTRPPMDKTQEKIEQNSNLGLCTRDERWRKG